MYEYLSGIDKEGTGVLLLLALEIISKFSPVLFPYFLILIAEIKRF